MLLIARKDPRRLKRATFQFPLKAQCVRASKIKPDYTITPPTPQKNKTPLHRKSVGKYMTSWWTCLSWECHHTPAQTGKPPAGPTIITSIHLPFRVRPSRHTTAPPSHLRPTVTPPFLQFALVCFIWRSSAHFINIITTASCLLTVLLECSRNRSGPQQVIRRRPGKLLS